MKLVVIFLFLALLLSCNRAAPIATNVNSNTPARSEQPQSMIAHSSEGQPPKPVNATGGKWSQSGDPIDTSKFDSAITVAEKDFKAKPSDAAKKALVEAYFQRGVALTDARQYASALGDYRRALKLDPTHEESKNWVEQIVNIYAMMKKEAPKEGEEPPPLPFKKG